VITLELEDGSVKKFNLTPEKEQKLLALWEETRNKKIRLTTSEGETIDIRLYDILDCYLGEKFKTDPSKGSGSMPGFFEDFLKKGGF
jgi:hypothetical protein